MRGRGGPNTYYKRINSGYVRYVYIYVASLVTSRFVVVASVQLAVRHGFHFPPKHCCKTDTSYYLVLSMYCGSIIGFALTGTVGRR